MTISRLLLACLLLATPALAVSENQAEIRLLKGSEHTAWVGQKMDIHLELWTDALSFADQSFVLPQVTGGYLLQADSTTIKLSDRRGQTTWQGLRYTFSLYPQRESTLEVPPFDVQFSTRAGYMSEPIPHEFRTPPLAVEARLPPGADGSALLVTSSDFNLATNWQPAPSAEGIVELQTGDALVLNLSRSAKDLPGMVFSPLPVWTTEGLGIYPSDPIIDDRVNRGAMTGTRTDRLTLVCESPGTYTLPELRFQWWDLEQQVLHTETIPALTLEVTVSPVWGAPVADEGQTGGTSIDWRWLWLIPVVLLAWWPGAPLTSKLFGWLKRELGTRRLPLLNPGQDRH